MEHEALLSAAQTLFERGDESEALGLVDAIIAEAPRAHDALYLAAKIHAKQRRPRLAAHALCLVLAQQPEDIASWTALGEVYMQAGDYERATIALRRAMQLDPEAKHPAGCRARAVVARTLASIKKKDTKHS